MRVRFLTVKVITNKERVARLNRVVLGWTQKYQYELVFL